VSYVSMSAEDYKLVDLFVLKQRYGSMYIVHGLSQIIRSHYRSSVCNHYPSKKVCKQCYLNNLFLWQLLGQPNYTKKFREHDWLQSLKWCSHTVQSIKTIWSNQLLGFNFSSFSTLNPQHMIGKGEKSERVLHRLTFSGLPFHLFGTLSSSFVIHLIRRNMNGSITSVDAIWSTSANNRSTVMGYFI